MMSYFAPFALLSALAVPSGASACYMSGDRPYFVSETEGLHTKIEDGDYAGFVELVRRYGGFDAQALADSLAAAVPDGFKGCRTILQRREVGGMKQAIAQFQADDRLVYVYTLSAIENGAYTLLSLNLSEDSASALANLR